MGNEDSRWTEPVAPVAPEAEVDAARYLELTSGQTLTLGEIVSDRVTKEIGSWRFIGIYFVLLLLWMIVNTVAWIQHWDPYPFIFLNLVLSFQGAFAAPILLMSQNRQEARDRLEEQYDHAINLRAEREIDLLREYRTRLIADVVTGKLDVREAAARLPDEAEEPEALDEIAAEGEGGEAGADDADEVPAEAEA